MHNTKGKETMLSLPPPLPSFEVRPSMIPLPIPLPTSIINSIDLRSSSASINHPNVLSSPIGTATGSRRRSIMRGSPCSPCPQPIAEVVSATRLLLRRRTAHESLAPFKLQSGAQSSTPISRLSFLFQHCGPRATPAPDAGAAHEDPQRASTMRTQPSPRGPQKPR